MLQALVWFSRRDLQQALNLLDKALHIPLKGDYVRSLPKSHIGITTAAQHSVDGFGLKIVSTIDLVMAAHMLEHLLNPAIRIKEMVRILRPGAPVILAVTRPGYSASGFSGTGE